MAVSGTWILHYSWGCTGSYGQVSMTFNGDGSFSGGIAGQWRQREGTILLSFTSGPAKYGGTVNGSVGSGAMSTFAGLDGCWYLTRQGISGVSTDVSSTGDQAYDVTGTALGGSEAGQGEIDASGTRR